MLQLCLTGVLCARPTYSTTDYDVMLTICYALTLQSALLPAFDVDFTIFNRGCAMITERIQSERKQTIFNLPPDPALSPAKYSITPRCK